MKRKRRDKEKRNKGEIEKKEHREREQKEKREKEKNSPHVLSEIARVTLSNPFNTGSFQPLQAWFGMRKTS